MPPRTRKRSATNDSSGSKQPPAKKPARAPARTNTRQSKPATTKAVQNAKKRFSPAEIESKIRSQGDDFIDFMEEELGSRPKSGFSMKDITDKLTPDLEPVSRFMTATKGRSTREHEEAPHLKAIAAIKDLENLIEEYETSLKEEHRIKKPDWMHWSQDAKELNGVNQLARNYADEAIKHTVVPGLHPSAIKPPEAGNDFENVAWVLTRDSRPEKTEETWGMAALEQMKTFTKILKLLPGDQTSPK